MRKFIRYSFISLIGVLWFAVSVPSWAAGTIKIGIIGPMKFSQGQSQWNGAEMAADEINSIGGFMVGKQRMKIQLIKADSNEFINIADATNAMEKLLLRDKVDFVIGGFASEAVLAMQDVAMDNKTIFIGAGASHPQLCLRVAENYDRYKYWFRGTPFNTDDQLKGLLNQVRSVATLLKKHLNIERIKIAIVAEKAIWTDRILKAAEDYLPFMGMEVVGSWRPERNAEDLTAELLAIKRTGCHMILTLLSSRAGIPLVQQAGEMKLPAVQLGINVIAAKDNFWEATEGMANYVMHQNSYCEGAEYNERTKPFVDGYKKRYHEVPSYTAGTYSIIKYVLGEAIEKAGSIEANRVIKELENGMFKSTEGGSAFTRDVEGRPLHDIKHGPGFSTGLGIQWQDGKQVAVWPHFKWMGPIWEYSAETPDRPNEMSYKGLKSYIIPPWVVEAYKK